jgi:hypothetical protein
MVKAAAPRRAARTLAAIALAGALLAGLPAAAAEPGARGDAGDPREADVKAALVLRVVKYVGWPPGRAPQANEPLRVCAVEAAAVAAALEHVAREGSRVTVHRVGGDTGDLLRCHVVLFADDPGIDLDYALLRLASQPILTVGGSDRFVDDGGMLALVTRERRVTFVVNLAAARRAGLQVSARLLQMSTVVDEAAP